MKQNIQDQWLTLRDVCDYTGLSPSTIYRSTQSGTLKVSKKTGKNFQKCQQMPILAKSAIFWKKSGSVAFEPLLVPNFMPSF